MKTRIIAKIKGQSYFWKEIVVGICIINFLLIHLTASLKGVDTTSTAILFGAYYKAFIVGANEYFRFLTVGFTHIMPYHIFFNLVAFWQLGSLCERIYSEKKAALILFISTIVGSCYLFIMQGNLLAVGLSGGIYGFFGAIVVFHFDSEIVRIPSRRKELARLLIINFMISLLPTVSLEAHLGGFFAGIVMGILFSRKLTWKELRANMKVVTSVAVILLGYFIFENRGIAYEDLYVGTDLEVIQLAKDLGLTGYSNQLHNKMNNYYIGKRR